jgi:hypothetical protein
MVEGEKRATVIFPNPMKPESRATMACERLRLSILAGTARCLKSAAIGAMAGRQNQDFIL